MIFIATLVPDNERTLFLPTLVGNSFMKFERYVYNMASRVSPDYVGGLWKFMAVKCPEGESGYLYPSVQDPDFKFHVSGLPNYYEGDMSPQTFGLFLSLTAMNHLIWDMHESSKAGTDELIEKFYTLRDYAAESPEAPEIFAAID